MRCYRVIEQIKEPAYIRLVDWIVVEETQTKRFLVISSASNRVYEEPWGSRANLTKDTKNVVGMLRTLFSSEESLSVNNKLWIDSGADTIDGAIDKVKVLLVDRLLQGTKDEAMLDENRNRNKTIKAQLKSEAGPTVEIAADPKGLHQGIEQLFSEPGQKASIKKAYWKDIEPTPARRECQLLVFE